MGTTKTAFFTKQQIETADLLKALGHPARIAILEYLLEVNTCICGDIVNELPLAQPTISQHLKLLKDTGLIQGEIEGNRICYCINKTTFARLQAYIGTFLSKMNDSENCC